MLKLNKEDKKQRALDSAFTANCTLILAIMYCREINTMRKQKQQPTVTATKKNTERHKIKIYG